MKLALITDQHFGGKQDSQLFVDYIERFYTKQFLPYLQDHEIDTVIDLGDTFDRRKFVNFNILDKVRKFYFDILHERDIELYSIVGNHSTYYKNTNVVNSSQLLYGHYSNVSTFPHPSTINVDGTSIDIIPWINSENIEETYRFIKESSSQILFGHIEIHGFAMYKGYDSKDGIPPSMFNKYEVVCSGHYHHKSSKGNIHYLGAPYQITWNDYDDPRGFHIFDTETRELKYIENKDKLFLKIFYDDKNVDYTNLDTEIYRNKVVKLVVEKKTDVKQFDNFLNQLYDSNPADLIILEDLSEYTMRYGDDTDDDVETINTSTFLDEYVDGMNIEPTECSRVKKLLKVIYSEALNIE